MPAIAARPAIAGLVASAGVVFACLAADVAGTGTGTDPARWKQHDVRRPKPPVVEPAGGAGAGAVAAKPPADAVVLFDGSGLGAWKAADGSPAKWRVAGGLMETVPGAGPIETRATFGDIQLHAEWAAPDPPVGEGQDRGNSGIFLMGQFEIQVLDSYRAETYADGQAGAIYGQFPPLFNAARPPGQWQTYDIAFRRPRFDGSGALREPARVTLFHNGILVQNNEAPFGPTSWLKWLPYEDKGGRGPISLQDHDHPVRYRNIWLRELPERPAPGAKDLARPKTVTLPLGVLDAYAGQYLVSAKPGAPKATFAREGGHLVVTFPFRPRPLALEPVSETEFDLPSTDGRFTFLKDDQGRVTAARFRVGDSRRDMKRVGP